MWQVNLNHKDEYLETYGFEKQNMLNGLFQAIKT